MITAINPKLPMRNRDITRQYYEKQLGFTCIGSQEFMHYLIMQKDEMQIHFFEFKLSHKITFNPSLIIVKIGRFCFGLILLVLHLYIF